MPTKKPLPSERNGKTFKAKIANNAIYLRTGEYEDGSLGEIFIEMYKEGAAFKAILGCFSICVSWLIQYGVPLEKIVDKFTFTRFEPSGMVTGDKEIKMCTSILDYVFRRIAISYLNDSTFINVKPPEVVEKDLRGVVLTPKSELPEFVDEAAPVSEEAWNSAEDSLNVPDIHIYTLGSGSIGLRPVGYKHEEFLKYCRKNAKQDSPITGKFTLQFNDDSIVVFAPPMNQEESVTALKHLFFNFYGKTLKLGDV